MSQGGSTRGTQAVADPTALIGRPIPRPVNPSECLCRYIRPWKARRGARRLGARIMQRDAVSGLRPILYGLFVIFGAAAVIGPPLYVLLRSAGQ